MISRDLRSIPARHFDQDRRKFERNTMNAKKGRCEALFRQDIKKPLNKKKKKIGERVESLHAFFEKPPKLNGSVVGGKKKK